VVEDDANANFSDDGPTVGGIMVDAAMGSSIGTEYIAVVYIGAGISTGAALDDSAAAAAVAIEIGQIVVPNTIVSVKTVVYLDASEQSGTNGGHKVTVFNDVV